MAKMEARMEVINNLNRDNKTDLQKLKEVTEEFYALYNWQKGVFKPYLRNLQIKKRQLMNKVIGAKEDPEIDVKGILQEI